MAPFRTRLAVTLEIVISLWAVTCAGEPIGTRLPEGYRVPSAMGKEMPKEMLKGMPKEMPCPDAKDIEPCVCSVSADYAMTMDCSNVSSEDELKTVFSQYFPFKDFQNLKIYFNENLKALREGYFGDCSFQKIDLYRTTLSEVEDQALAGSHDTLQELRLTFSEMTSFPDISAFSRLQLLDVTNNTFTEIPKFTSSTLQELYLISNSFETIPADAFSGLPALQILYLEDCFLTEVLSGTFASNENLSELYLTHNNLTTIPSDTIKLNGPQSRLDLTNNQITSLSLRSFTGVTSEVYMAHNSLRELEEEVWRPLLENNIALTLKDNPFGCGCDIAWLVLHRTLLDRVADTPRCADGTAFKDLDPDMYAALCP